MNPVLRGSAGRAGDGFSLVELVVAIVIVAILAAIAVPRLSRSASRAASSALRSDLATLRHAIELYRAEHDGRLPTVAGFASQMTRYTRVDGSGPAAAPDPASGIVYGPYLRSIPPLPVGANKGSTQVVPSFNPDGGWIYDPTTGEIRACAGGTETDPDGVAYRSY